MATSAGRWVSVSFSDGRVRFDWIPTAQPPAPTGQSGAWHVVNGGSRQPTRWEWHAAPEAAAPGRSDGPATATPAVRDDPERRQPPPAMPAVRAPATVEVLPERVYRTKRSMGVWFWLGAVILAAIGGAGAVAMSNDQRAQASLAATAKPAKGSADRAADNEKPSKAELVTVAQGYLTALLAGNVDELLSYLDPSCDGAEPGFALAARWAGKLAGGATVNVREVEVHGRRGSVTDFSLDGISGDTQKAVRTLITDENTGGEQTFPWHYAGGQWYFKGDCGTSGSAIAAAGTPGPTRAPAGGGAG